MKKILITALLGISATAFSQARYLCFKNDKNPNLQIQLYFDEGIPDKGGSVKYKGKKTSIPIELTDFFKPSAADIPSTGYRFNEVYDFEVTGEYEYWEYYYKNRTVKKLSYTNSRNGKEYNFIQYKEQNKPCF